MEKILKIDGVNDEFVLAYYCPQAAVLESGYYYVYVDENLDDNWKDTKNHFPLEDWDNYEDEYHTMYYNEVIYVYISRRGNILTVYDRDDGYSEPMKWCYNGPEQSLDDMLEWMDDLFKEKLNDPDNIYILDAITDLGGHTNFVLIDDEKFIDKVGNMPRNEIYRTVQDYISKYDDALERCEASTELIKDGKVTKYLYPTPLYILKEHADGTHNG